jgi:RND family efflux transporter MFP subunit
MKVAYLAALALLAAGCGKKESASDAEAAPVVGARTAVATRQAVRETIDGIATVAPRAGRFAQLSAPAATRVTRIYVTVGASVAAGAPLIALDRTPFDAQAASAATALAAAQRGYERAKRLVDAGIAARKDLDQAASELARANADAVAARRLQSQATLRAPIAGVVTRMSAVLSAAVDPSQMLVEVADLSALDLLMTVPPAAAARVHSGAAVEIASQASADGEPLGTATVADVGGTVDSTARGVVVRSRITHPARQLRIGETVFGRIVASARSNAVTVPVASLVPDGEGFKVFVLDASRTAHATPVTVGVRDGTVAEILSGLRGGETVVTYGAFGVEDSAKVLPSGEGPAATPIPTGASRP